ncbi:YbaB/EbfC family nucleoid-associated protein [Asanoa sp. NPDC049518]|uniref:YbaB/EbfC family nucleoid-associated protein n=1 Tax=unclassified Asanoa TaxID=2685164 RepID=UPI00342E4939
MSTDASAQGTAFAGQVRVFATARRLERVELEPQLLRLTPDELGAYVVEAANLALAEETAPIDPAVLDEALRTAMESGSALMRTISESLGDVMFRLRERTGMSGDPGTQGLSSVLDEAGDLLRLATNNSAPAERTGEGAAGAVTATVRAGPRVVEIGIAGSALRLGADTLAEEIVTAVNDGLDRLGDATAAAEASPVTPQRIRDVQDASLAHMRAYTGALRALLGSVGGPVPTTRERSDDG